MIELAMKLKHHITTTLALGLLSACGPKSVAVDDDGAAGGTAPSGDGGAQSGGGSGGTTNFGGASATGGRPGNVGGGGSPAAGGGLGGLGGSAGPPADENCGAPKGACELFECAPTQLTGDHVATCSVLEPTTNPPVSGPHYSVWAQFGIYDQAIADGFFIHSLEHSAVALLYDCDAAAKAGLDCVELRQSLLDFYEAFPADPLCSDVPNRLIVAPRPGLGVPFAAAAWGYYLRGNCFDADQVSAFVAAHYGMNYENICNTGVDPLNPGCSE
jgi:hypothetical protein